MAEYELSDQEAELINMLRGYTAEGANLEAPTTLVMRLDVNDWTVRTEVLEMVSRIQPSVGAMPRSMKHIC